MGNSRKSGYNVHNLTFLRNNSYPQEIIFEKEQNYFFMMDYYNLLKIRSLDKETDGYMKLVGSEKDENNAVAKRIMGLYSEKNFQEEKIFKNASVVNGITSKSPFLGIIQIYIADYVWKKDNMPVRVQQIDSYLETYENEIRKNVDNVLDEDDICCIYKTITSEDFCVIIRTSKISTIYYAALKIMDIKNQTGKRVFFTYTNIAIECVQRTEAGDKFLHTSFSSLNEAVRIKNQDINFVLRFRIENKGLEEIQSLEIWQKNKNENEQQVIIEDVNGMIGRYDLVVRLSIHDFMEIYPYLCMNVTGNKFEHIKLSLLNGRLSKILVEKMRDGIIQTINTRIIVNIYAKAKVENDNTRAVSLLDEVDFSKIKERTACVMSLYIHFKEKHDNKFAADKYRYLELVRMLDTLIYSYENLAYEIDTHINWFICSQYLENFFQSMNAYMDALGENIEPAAIEKFLNEFQAFISAFDAYLRLLQGINQNTIQSPRYDISTPIDGLKFLMAYGEFIDSVHEEYRNDDWKAKEELACQEERRIENTIIYPDLTIKNLELMETFSYDNVKISDVNHKNSAVLICKIPMFEYFERPYDLIPLILHEICHHMLILKRSVRNEFLIKMIFERIAAEAIKQVQGCYVKKEYGNRVDALTKLMEESLADALVEIFKENCADYKEYVFLHLIKRINSFVYSYFEDEEQKRNNLYVSYSIKNITQEFEILISEIYEDDEAALRNFRDIDLSIIMKSNEAEVIDCNRKLFRLAKDLLEQINKITIAYNEPIVMKELLGKNNQELDDYLLQWIEKNETKILHAGNGEMIERKQLLKNYLALTKRTFILVTEAVCIKKDRAGSFRKQLAKKFGKKAKKQFTKFLKEYYYIYDQDKMKKKAFWEFEYEQRAQQHYIEAMECIDSGRIIGAIKFSWTNYREVCADIVMCRWLGLNSFGYFRTAIALAPRMQGYAEQIQYGAMQWERLRTVLAVLATYEDLEKQKIKETQADLNPMEHLESETKKKIKEIDLSDLQRNIWQYIEVTLNCAKNRIKSAMDADENLDKEHADKTNEYFFQVVEEQMQMLQKRVLDNKRIVWEDSVWDSLNKRKIILEKIDDYFPYFYKEANIFKRLYDMLEIYSCIQTKNKLHIKSEVHKHVFRIYINATKANQPHKVVKEVARFYNDPTSEKKTNAQKLADMLLFVQDYYYCNRIKKAEEE